MKTILITGAGKRLGRHLAIRFAEKGNNIILHFNSSELQANETKQIIEKYNINCYLFKADLTNHNYLIDFIEFIKDNNLEPNILINNAAIYPSKQSLNDLSYEQWLNTLNINLNSIFLLTKLIYSNFNSLEKIVNIASLGAFHIWENRIDYNVSKAALVQLTKSLARNLAPNIAVNSVSPGTIFFPDEQPSEPLTLNENKIPFGRFANPDEVFEAVNFFSFCSNYITGQNLNIDGGLGLI